MKTRKSYYENYEQLKAIFQRLQDITAIQEIRSKVCFPCITLTLKSVELLDNKGGLPFKGKQANRNEATMIFHGLCKTPENTMLQSLRAPVANPWIKRSTGSILST
ncbi:hypothetical protein Y1Q_0020036 [Alligator mississippiensis]|uniref:Uncharacterized protein n=1 Tax=Alligator mississippiensis TaxID=8496 RepID=A0A151LYR5_ALLMI|nr:hypothetical protein Y1Q_0020036 [Alligator mississippiensis]